MNLTKSELLKLRALLLFAAISAMGWGLFLDQTVGEGLSLAIIRYADSTVSLFCLAFTFIWPISRWRSDIMLVLCAVVMLTTSLMTMGHFDYNIAIVVGDVILILTGMSVIRARPLAISLNLFFLLKYVPLFILQNKTSDHQLALGVVVLTFFAGIFLHLTRYDLEKIIDEKDKWLQFMIDGLDDRVLLVDRNCKVITTNAMVRNVFGEVEGKNLAKIVADDWSSFDEQGIEFDFEKWIQEVVSHVGEQKILRTFYVINKKNKIKRWVHFSAASIKREAHFSTPDLVMAHYSDVTAYYEQQSMILEQQAALANASRLTAMGEMAGGIAHEINNPLAIIVGRVEQLQRLNEEGTCSKDEVDQILSRISETVFRIKKLIATMKSITRNNENDPFEWYDISLIVQDTLELCNEGLRWKGINLISEIPKGHFIECRPWQISQILLNLLNNAKDAVFKLDEKWISIKVEFEAENVIFRVTDSGPGIPNEILSKIMQPFFTTKEVGTGTGLGLSISLAIAKSHKGHIFVNADSPNTEFVLTIPKKQNALS